MYRTSKRAITAIAVSVFGAASALGSLAHAQQASEIPVSTVGFGDIEFDWGRDGINCPTCNFGQGNARYNWTDRSGKIWVGHVDAGSGAFTPAAGNNELVTSASYFWYAWGNGPEWAFSTQNGSVISQLVYTRYISNPALNAVAAAALATPTATGWTSTVLPGAIGTSTNKRVNSTILPEASQCNSDPVAQVLFHNVVAPAEAFTEQATTTAGTAPTLTPFGSYDNGIGERWVPCTHQLLFQGSAPPDSTGTVYQQVFWYDADTQVVQQLTTNSHGKHAGFMFEAPDFNHSNIFFTVSSGQEIDVYEQTGVLVNGAPKFKLVNQIRSPDPEEPFINSPEPFINCTPTCVTYVFMTLSSSGTSQNGHTIPNGIAVAALNPDTPLFKILVPAASLPAAQRLDPEYFITANGPYLYYQLGTVQTSTKAFHILGEYYSDMGLGAPSGACVGSSAQGGLVPGC